MSARRILRIALSLVILVILWIRVGSEWASRSSSWIVGAITLSLILVVVVIFEVTGPMQGKRKPKDGVPKKPLGLD